MKTIFSYKILTGLWVILMAFIVGCSAEKNTLVSRAYHNLTARYNAYFLANERMKEIEAIYWQNHDDNYYNILSIYPKVDTVMASYVKEPLEDCIVKASLAIQNHKNSKWVDDSYVLVGKARYYDADFVNAIETFKYVNVNSKDDNARHEALVFLMRTFIDYKEEQNAIAVSDFLQKEKLNKKNLKSLYLTRAYLYQQRQDYNNMVQNLALAAPLLSKNDKPARLHFIIGQVFQTLGFESLAYEHYRESLKNNPAYELSFYARLNMAQVFELADNKDVSKARRYFVNLLNDNKNKEFRDKIYYEMAEFERKQGNQEEAITYYKNSAQASVNNNRQKSYAFHRLGQIYYEEIKNYELAKAYYDSTIAVMPTTEEDYERIKKRQEILADFVQQLNTIALQDSLIHLSHMDSSALIVMADQRFVEQQQNLQLLSQSTRQAGGFSGQNNFFSQGSSETQTGTWYFYSTASISTGRAEFVRRWGNRPLQDNWRRNKTLVNRMPNAMAQNVPQEKDTETSELSEEDQKKAHRQEFFSQIPFSEEARALAHMAIEEAYYTLGNIYNFNLDEPQNAKETFITLLDRYPDTSHEPEVLYLLYIISNNLQPHSGEPYKEKLLSEFPNSTYAKTIRNPNYKQESEALSAELQKLYATAFNAYKGEDYVQADSLLSYALNEYPTTDFTDNLTLLKIMLIGKTGHIAQYQYRLEQFMEDFPDSELIGYAQSLLEASRQFQTAVLKAGGVQSFIEDFDQTHIFVLVYDKDFVLASLLPEKLDILSEQNFKDMELRSGNMSLNEQQGMIMVNEFESLQDALAYRAIVNQDSTLNSAINENKVQDFIITKDNFQILSKTKDITSYVSFFEEHY